VEVQVVGMVESLFNIKNFKENFEDFYLPYYKLRICIVSLVDGLTCGFCNSHSKYI